ncbi:MAG: nicotinamide-nucleotide amidohydrolase family protein [Firmicutes bacterium]|nr:nicotinamide-nucleotide amidohydrolase family protein [Bacillota bacterium]
MKKLNDLTNEVHQMLKASKMRLKLTESFTGGLISSLLVQNTGASEYLIEGIVCYSNISKQQILNIPQDIIDNYSAVSYAVCNRMMDGLNDCDISIAATGYADTHPHIAYIGVKTLNTTIIKKIALNKTRLQNIQTGALTALKILKEILGEKHNG